MAKSEPNPDVDIFINKDKKWKEETESLRTILLSCGLSEDLKWGKPCYSYEKSNIAIIQGFKDYFALLFFKGALLKDPKGILVKTGKNTHVGRQIRFAGVAEIIRLKPLLKGYVNDAIEIEKAGLKVTPQKTSEIAIPKEFKNQLKKNAALKKAFAALTPGRQKAYIFYFSQPRQLSTRMARIEKCLQRILDGKGLSDY